MKIVTVIPLQKTIFKEELTYFSSKEVKMGDIVSISIRNKKILGLVISSVDATKAKSEIKKMDFNLKKIIETKINSIFREEFIESVLLTSKYFVANKSMVFATLVPNIIKKKYDTIADIEIVTKNELENKNIQLKTEKLLYQNSLEDRISYYKTLIRSSFANKKSVFIVLPTGNEINQFKEELMKGIENFTISIHSGLTPKNTLEAINQILNNSHPLLILGTAPFLSLPRYDLNTIILEHESSNAYKTIARPYLDLKIFTEIFAMKIKAKLIFADTLLRFETIGRKELDDLSETSPLSFRIKFEGNIEILEKNKKDIIQNTNSKFKILSIESLKEIEKNISLQKKIFVFSLRKGLATFTICNHCGNEVTCDKCLAPVVLYSGLNNKKRVFVCNKCKTEKNPEMTCSHCHSWDLVPLGIGTDTIYQEIKKKFPDTLVFKLDKEIAKNSKEADKIIASFEKATNGAILVGTEMALFYLKEKVASSVLASFDSLWSIPNFKISEKIIQIILNIINKTKENLIIETKNVDDPLILAIKSNNFLPYIREELIDRKNLGYPPYKRFIKISYTDKKEELIKIKEELKNLLKDYDIQFFHSSNKSIHKNQYTLNVLIKLDIKKWSLSEISDTGSIDENLYSRLNNLSFKYQIDIDPENLL
jgi:primosomal protein N' (replication factor Y)